MVPATAPEFFNFGVDQDLYVSRIDEESIAKVGLNGTV